MKESFLFHFFSFSFSFFLIIMISLATASHENRIHESILVYLWRSISDLASASSSGDGKAIARPLHCWNLCWQDARGWEGERQEMIWWFIYRMMKYLNKFLVNLTNEKRSIGRRRSWRSWRISAQIGRGDVMQRRLNIKMFSIWCENERKWI